MYFEVDPHRGIDRFLRFSICIKTVTKLLTEFYASETSESLRVKRKLLGNCDHLLQVEQVAETNAVFTRDTFTVVQYLPQ